MNSTYIESIKMPERNKELIEYETRRARVNTRENSTLVIATVASSASLFLIAHELPDLHIYGLWFALLGIIYRELTIFLPDRHDQKKIRQFETDHGISCGMPAINRIPRSVLFRVFLWFPIIIFVLNDYSVFLQEIVFYAVIPVTILVPVILEETKISDC